MSTSFSRSSVRKTSNFPSPQSSPISTPTSEDSGRSEPA
ncbi:hypothetical protein D030_2395A, partial [Vibrio parahaemolyticus AQ3810]